MLTTEDVAVSLVAGRKIILNPEDHSTGCEKTTHSVLLCSALLWHSVTEVIFKKISE